MPNSEPKLKLRKVLDNEIPTKDKRLAAHKTKAEKEELRVWKEGLETQF